MDVAIGVVRHDGIGRTSTCVENEVADVLTKFSKVAFCKSGHEDASSEKDGDVLTKVAFCHELVDVELVVVVCTGVGESGTFTKTSDDSGLFCFDLSKDPCPASDLPRRNE